YAYVVFRIVHRRLHHPHLPDRGARAWEPRIRSAQNSPIRLLFPVRCLYLGAIDRAEHHIYITQAYFIPDREILAALIAAARRGVDVRGLSRRGPIHGRADWRARAYHAQRLEPAVRRWLFEDAMGQAKP